jgi:PAS domain S-box-containing protein
LVVALATLVVWQALRFQERGKIQDLTFAAAKSLRAGIRARFTDRLNDFFAKASLWTPASAPKSRADFEARLGPDLADGLQAYLFVGPDYRVQWVVPEEGNEGFKALNCAGIPPGQKILDSARARGKWALDWATELEDGRKAFWFCTPIYKGEELLGFTVLVCPCQEFLEQVVDPDLARGYAAVIMSGDREIYVRRDVTASAAGAALAVEMRLEKVSWRIRVWPGDEALAAMKSPLPAVGLAAGLGLATLVALGLRLTQVFRRRAQQAEEANRALRAEMATRLRLERELMEERYLLNILCETWPDKLYFKDRQSRFIRVSNSVARHFHVDRVDGVLGKTDFDFFTPEHALPAFEDEQEILRTGKPLIGKEERETLRDGRVCWVLTTKMPLRDSQGNLTGTFGLSTDITARKRTEEALRQSEVFYHSLVENLPQNVLRKDLEGRFTFANQRVCIFFGKSRDEIVGSTDYDLFPRELADKYREDDRRVIESGEQFEAVEEHQRPGGERLFVRVVKSPIRNADGQTLGTQCMFWDVTQMHLAQEALREAKEDADAANRAKSEFLANMSHEIRTPMNGILGMTELALGTDLSPEQRQYLEMARASAECLLKILNDILDFSKIEAGKLDLDTVEFDLRETLGDALKTFGVRAHEKGLELACHIPPKVPALLVGDPLRLRLVVLNLVGTAVKFTDQGEVVVELSAEPPRDGQTVLHVAVRDTGVGIPKEQRETIFGAFSQGDSSITRKHGGTGLGLAISAQLVALMGGRIWVESESGRGSTFHFTARFGVAEETGRAPVCREDLDGLAVLVVDDNATSRSILREMVTSWGMRATTADGGSAAVAILAEAAAAGRAFSLILLDAVMPEMDGFDVLAQIRRRPELAGATVLMLSSADRPSDAARCRELGVSVYLRKPTKQSELLDAITAALGSAVGPRSARRPEDILGADLPPLRILLAEDNEVNQELAVRLLQMRGHRVVVCGNGREALDTLAAGSFDVVLMDVQMPEMDGLAATAALRERDKQTGGHVPVVAMTAHAMKGDRERCLAAGMDAYVSKPLRIQELLDVLGSVVDRSADQNLPAEAPDGTPPLFDPEEMLTLAEGEMVLVQELVQVFLSQTPGLLREIARAVDGRDAPALERAAHKLRGSLNALAARPVAELAQALEQLGRSGDLAGAEATRSQLEQAIAALMDQMLSVGVAG